jgi:hypothetical protein
MSDKRRIKELPSKRTRNIKDPIPVSSSSEQMTPVFSLEHHVKTGKYSLRTCDPQSKTALIDKLYELSQLSWGQIRQAPRHGVGYEKIESKNINAAIPKHLHEKSFIAFRYKGLAPMVGFREGVIFHLVWLDSGLDLYDH